MSVEKVLTSEADAIWARIRGLLGSLGSLGSECQRSALVNAFYALELEIKRLNLVIRSFEGETDTLDRLKARAVCAYDVLQEMGRPLPSAPAKERERES